MSGVDSADADLQSTLDNVCDLLSATESLLRTQKEAELKRLDCSNSSALSLGSRRASRLLATPVSDAASDPIQLPQRQPAAAATPTPTAAAKQPLASDAPPLERGSTTTTTTTTAGTAAPGGPGGAAAAATAATAPAPMPLPPPSAAAEAEASRLLLSLSPTRNTPRAVAKPRIIPVQVYFPEAAANVAAHVDTCASVTEVHRQLRTHLAASLGDAADSAAATAAGSSELFHSCDAGTMAGGGAGGGGGASAATWCGVVSWAAVAAGAQLLFRLRRRTADGAGVGGGTIDAVAQLPEARSLPQPDAHAPLLVLAATRTGPLQAAGHGRVGPTPVGAAVGIVPSFPSLGAARHLVPTPGRDAAPHDPARAPSATSCAIPRLQGVVKGHDAVPTPTPTPPAPTPAVEEVRLPVAAAPVPVPMPASVFVPLWPELPVALEPPVVEEEEAEEVEEEAAPATAVSDVEVDVSQLSPTIEDATHASTPPPEGSSPVAVGSPQTQLRAFQEVIVEQHRKIQQLEAILAHTGLSVPEDVAQERSELSQHPLAVSLAERQRTMTADPSATPETCTGYVSSTADRTVFNPCSLSIVAGVLTLSGRGSEKTAIARNDLKAFAPYTDPARPHMSLGTSLFIDSTHGSHVLVLTSAERASHWVDWVAREYNAEEKRADAADDTSNSVLE